MSSLRTYRICLTEPRRATTLLDVIRRAEADVAAHGPRPSRIVIATRRGAFA